MALVENAAPPAPATNRLQDYPVDVDAGDLFRHASGDVAEKWVAMANGLSSLAAESAFGAGTGRAPDPGHGHELPHRRR
jgi:hypothetical protein